MRPRTAVLFGALAMVAALGAVAMACGGGGNSNNGGATGASAATPTTSSGSQQVRVVDNSYSPNNLTVAPGSTVKWTWGGSLPHSVTGTFNGQAVDSGVKESGSFEFTFSSAGEFNYQCSVHGAAMSGKVTVR